MTTSSLNEIAGMTCCEKGRIGDGHKGCYDEAAYQQQKNQPTWQKEFTRLFNASFVDVTPKDKP